MTFPVHLSHCCVMRELRNKCGGNVNSRVSLDEMNVIRPQAMLEDFYLIGFLFLFFMKVLFIFYE